jgi:hypothetical protein
MNLTRPVSFHHCLSARENSLRLIDGWGFCGCLPPQDISNDFKQPTDVFVLHLPISDLLSVTDRSPMRGVRTSGGCLARSLWGTSSPACSVQRTPIQTKGQSTAYIVAKLDHAHTPQSLELLIWLCRTVDLSIMGQWPETLGRNSGAIYQAEIYCFSETRCGATEPRVSSAPHVTIFPSTITFGARVIPTGLGSACFLHFPFSLRMPVRPHVPLTTAVPSAKRRIIRFRPPLLYFPLGSKTFRAVARYE